MRKKIRSEQSETLKKVLRYLKRYWFFLALSFGLAAITVASTLYIPLLTGDAVDCVIGKDRWILQESLQCSKEWSWLSV